MDPSLENCHWPELQEPYLGALKEAVAYLIGRYANILGILISGSILRGQADRTSDLDIYVVHAKPERQRLQKFFNGVPAEIFVNPPNKIEAYFQEEQAEGRPISAHMWATGFVVLECDPAISRLKELAQTYLNSVPNPSEEQRIFLRYFAAADFEDAIDIVERNPASALVILNRAVTNMLHYAYLKHSHFIPRNKELVERLAEVDPLLAALTEEYLLSGDLPRKVALAEEIADRTIGTRGFFEWESAPEPA